MIELFRQPKINWIAAKKYFIPLSLVLLLAGAISVTVRGFNLGIDFSGGSILNVRFKEPTSDDEIRDALHTAGLDTTKVTIQTVLGRSNEVLIRAPQSGNEFQDRRNIIRALHGLSPEGDQSAGRVNVNTLTAEGVEQELRIVDPLGINNRNFAGPHPYRLVGDQIVSFRDGQQKGFITDMNAVLGLTFTAPTMGEGFDQDAVKRVLGERLYAGKIDLNLAGVSEIEDALIRIDPLGIRGQASANETYRKAADAIKRYRTDRDGVIGNLNEIQVQDVPADLLAKMEPYFTTGNFAVISADVVGPQVGEDLRNRAIYVTLAALAGMLIYIAFRFEWVYGVAAVAAVFHDVMVTLGIFSLLGEEISLTVIAALLTLVGYSMNDTIVIFDRIRENLHFRRRESLAKMANDAINQTLSRTVITNGLTFVSVVAILLFGGEVLRGFALALTVGIVVGTYSTVAVASPIMLWWSNLTGAASGGRAAKAPRKSEATLAKV